MKAGRGSIDLWRCEFHQHALWLARYYLEKLAGGNKIIIYNKWEEDVIMKLLFSKYMEILCT